MNALPRTRRLIAPLLLLTGQSLTNQYSKMYQLNCTITKEQRSLLADALYYYSEMLNNDSDKNEVINALEELEEHLDAHFKEQKPA